MRTVMGSTAGWAGALLVACSTQEHAEVVMRSAVVESLAIVESDGARDYRVYAPGGALEVADDVPDDARLTVLGFGMPLAALEIIDAEGRLRLAEPSTPIERTAPLPTPVEGWVGPVLGPYQPLELASGIAGRPERIALSDCPELVVSVTTDSGHPGFTPVFLTAGPQDVWALFGNVDHAGRAFRCTPRGCARKDAYPQHVVRPVAALDTDGTPWWWDGGGHLMRGLDAAATSSIALPAGVRPVGLVMHAEAVLVLDDADTLHRYTRAADASAAALGTGTWDAAPRDLGSGLAARACRTATSMPNLWVDARGHGGALLTRACRWVDVGSSTVTTAAIDAEATGLAYGRDGPVEALIVELGPRAPQLFRRHSGGPWTEIDAGATPGGTVFEQARAPTVAVVGGDVFTVRTQPGNGMEEILTAHGWVGHPDRAPLACMPDQHSVPAIAAAGGGLVAIRRYGDPSMQWFAVRARP